MKKEHIFNVELYIFEFLGMQFQSLLSLFSLSLLESLLEEEEEESLEEEEEEEDDEEEEDER